MFRKIFKQTNHFTIRLVFSVRARCYRTSRKILERIESVRKKNPQKANQLTCCNITWTDLQYNLSTCYT